MEEEKSEFTGAVQDTPNPVSKKLKLRWLWLIILVPVIYGVYRTVSFYLTPGRAIQQIYLIPGDAIFIIHSDSPVADWGKISESAPWQSLKRSPSFAEIDRGASVLDSILHENRKLFSLVGKRDLMISAHKVRSDFWDFLFVIDLQKISEIEILKDQIENVYSLMDYRVTYRKYQHIDIIELRDPKTREILYTAFVENHFIASYSSKLVEASINERNDPLIGLDPLFMEADKLTGDKNLFRIYVQYARLPLFLEKYNSKENEYMSALCRSMAYAGLSFNTSNDKFDLEGYTLLNDTVDPYISALLHSGKKEMKAHQILSARTAFYTNISFDTPAAFLKELEKALLANNPDFYATYQTSYRKIESTFGLSLEEEFLSWMSGEFALIELEPGLLGYDTEMVLCIQAKNINQAKEQMASVERNVKRRTPVNVKKVTYKDYDINYVELKGFFSLFFGKMFDKFEKPYYTYINDYVVFSNKPATLLSFIADYEQGYILHNDPDFLHVLGQVEKYSTYFLYINTAKFFPLLRPVFNTKSWNDLNTNKDIALSFPTMGLQITGDRRRIPMHLVLNYRTYTEEPVIEDTDDEDAVATEKEILEELQRFYVEKFQGNLYREYYPDGAIKTKSEIKDGRRHGKYHEYYENGVLKVRGKYSKGQPKGTWKYYTEEGKFVEKVKM